MILPPLAVHLSDSVLHWYWFALGFVAAAGLLALTARRIADEEIPRLGLLTAAFFVASYIHVHVGPTSVHLLLNGLAGVILGQRAVLAIAIGLLLQALLLGHGGVSALGMNCCIIALPALFARPLFRWLSQAPGSVSFRYRDGYLAVAWILHPLLMLPFFFLVVIGIRRGWLGEEDPDFRAGYIVGVTCVMATVLLNATLLIVGGAEDWRLVAAVVLVAHIPIAFIEGVIVGCTARFLRRVRPELLGIEQPEFDQQHSLHA